MLLNSISFYFFYIFVCIDSTRFNLTWLGVWHGIFSLQLKRVLAPRATGWNSLASSRSLLYFFFFFSLAVSILMCLKSNAILGWYTPVCACMCGMPYGSFSWYSILTLSLSFSRYANFHCWRRHMLLWFFLLLHIFLLSVCRCSSHEVQKWKYAITKSHQLNNGLAMICMHAYVMVMWEKKFKAKTGAKKTKETLGDDLKNSETDTHCWRHIGLHCNLVNDYPDSMAQWMAFHCYCCCCCRRRCCDAIKANENKHRQLVHIKKCAILLIAFDLFFRFASAWADYRNICITFINLFHTFAHWGKRNQNNSPKERNFVRCCFFERRKNTTVHPINSVSGQSFSI